MTIRAQVSLRQLRVIIERLPGHVEAATKDMLEYWMQKIIVRHFQFGNATEYNYPRLDPKYLERKRKLHGRKPMLVASGLLKEQVTTSYKIYKIRNKFRVVMKIPDYGKYVRNIRDFTLVSKRDRQDMTRYHRKSLIKRRRNFVRQVKLSRR